jgi:hypothetical protein
VAQIWTKRVERIPLNHPVHELLAGLASAERLDGLAFYQYHQVNDGYIHKTMIITVVVSGAFWLSSHVASHEDQRM